MSDFSFVQNPTRLTRQSFMLKSIAPSSKLDVNRLLELLNVTNDISLQLKVFSALSVHLMFNKGANIDIIIKCHAVYDKIHYVLSKGLPGKSSEALNFLSALLYSDSDSKDIASKKISLTLYARNMTRVSGCLSTMCDMLTSSMMYHDTWKALCQCTAVACGGCEVNQSYCSHLIPVCIEKCSQENIDLLLVLQSLLLNHSRNVQLFLDCNGLTIFTRELLHYDKCLQVLTTVVQTSKSSPTLIHQTNVPTDLHDFIRLYGPDSQLGQKALVILNHISSSAKGNETRQRAFASKIRMLDKGSLSEEDDAKKQILEKDNTNTDNDFEETKVLMQNVLKEIFKLKQSEMLSLKKNDSNPTAGAKKPTMQNKGIISALERNQRNPVLNSKANLLKHQILNVTKKLKDIENTESNIDAGFSFSFLENDDFKVPINRESTKSFGRVNKNDTHEINMNDSLTNSSRFNNTVLDKKKDDKLSITTHDFDPVFASTPKHTTASVHYVEATANTQRISEDAKQSKYKELRMKRQKAKIKQRREKSIINKSVGARFFSAINESCTTFVKTVTNIFRKKKSITDSGESSKSTENIEVKDRRRSANSFMNYMKRRDAILNNKWNADKSAVSSFANACKTCNNTEVLKTKLTKDEFLKKTVKKLKLGINLYGCDFKKISKTMWPREKYMTPVVLYHLYRKLLLK